MVLRSALSAFATLTLATAAMAQETPTRDWSALTLGDVEAAHALILENHPGAAPRMRDTAFRARLEAARDLARTRATRVGDYGGYAATLRGFANGLGDDHIRWRGTWHPGTVRYPGFWIDLKGEAWTVVAADEANLPGPGARLISCDGEDASALAAARLNGFRADPAVPARLTAAAPSLMIDDGNPFIPLPVACVFESDGVRRDHALTWRSIAVKDVSARFAELYSRPRAGFGIRPFAAGTWIALERLDGEGDAVVKQVAAELPTLKASPLLVVDLRGNGGGDSSIGDDLARLLYGEAALARGQRTKLGCKPVWRASAGNLSTLKRYQVEFAGRGPETVAWFKGEADAVEAAIARGDPLSGPVTDCLEDAPEAPRATQAPADAPYQGKVVILTDSACFSSCLLMVKRFRGLGATQAGHPTDVGSWYMEVRDEPLPSGIGTFSVLGKVGLAAPRRLGPFEPDAAYPGDIADTAAVEAWVATTFTR